MADPPLLTGAVQRTVAEEANRVALPMVGAPGTVAAVGTTAFDSAESGPAPTTFVARTWNVYGIPGVRPEIARVRVPASGTTTGLSVGTSTPFANTTISKPVTGVSPTTGVKVQFTVA